MRSPLMEGAILSKEEYRQFSGIPAGRMRIRRVDTNVIVTALVNKATLHRFGPRLRFHYAGDPTQGVFLEGEEDPIWAFGVAVFFLVGSTTLLVLYGKFKGRPGFEHVIDCQVAPKEG